MQIRIFDLRRHQEINLQVEPAKTTLAQLLNMIRYPDHQAELWDDNSEPILIFRGHILGPLTAHISDLLPVPPKEHMAKEPSIVPSVTETHTVKTTKWPDRVPFPSPQEPLSPGAPPQLYLFVTPSSPPFVVNDTPVVKADELKQALLGPGIPTPDDNIFTLFMRLSGNVPSDPAGGQGTSLKTMNSTEFCEYLTEREAEKLAVIISMGFSQTKALNALIINRLNEEAAIDWLLQNQADLSDQPVPPEQLALLASTMGIELVEPIPEIILNAIRDQVCTFTTTGKEFCFQRWYQCLTCGLSGSAGVCIICAKRCHAGHQLSPQVRATGFYCDCGSGAYCKSLEPPSTVEKTPLPAEDECLASNYASSSTDDSHLRRMRV